MTTLAHVPLSQIHTHPSNPRFDAIADDGMVTSVEVQGILTPVNVDQEISDHATEILGQATDDTAAEAS